MPSPHHEISSPWQTTKLTLYHNMTTFDAPEENTSGKGESAGNQHFLRFSHTVFHTFEEKLHQLGHNESVVC